MNTQQPGIEEQLRSELSAAGAREYEIAALTLVPNRGMSAYKYALQKGAEHPVAYAIKIFDDPDWSPAGGKPRQSANLHVGTSKPLPAPNPDLNFVEARKILQMLRSGGDEGA